MRFDIKDISLAKKGELRIRWAEMDMPVLRIIRERFKEERPLRGIRIAACLHVTTETANLIRTLKSGGAEVVLCASNPLSTQDDVAAALVKYDKIPVFAIKGENNKVYYSHIISVLSMNPNITMDDGADLVSVLHKEEKKRLPNVIGGTEETTTGVIRLRNMAREGVLAYPIIAVNDALTKHLFDNRYGTGQSTIDGILRATNRLLSGSYFVVAGYGWCGRGLAMRAKGMGAKVIVTEVDPVKALEAVMDGFEVMPMDKAARIGDIFCTLTGNIDVITASHILKMKDGAIISNSGHFNVEIDIKGLNGISKSRRMVRDFVEEYTLKNGKRVYLLGEGRLINLASAEGHPASVMDMSFANQALSVEYILKNRKDLKKDVYTLPHSLDSEVASLKLKTLGISIDYLTKEQKRYLSQWQDGT